MDFPGSRDPLWVNIMTQLRKMFDARPKLKQTTTLEDMVQNVHVIMLHATKIYEPDKGPYEQWIWYVTKRRMLDAVVQDAGWTRLHPHTRRVYRPNRVLYAHEMVGEVSNFYPELRLIEDRAYMLPGSVDVFLRDSLRRSLAKLKHVNPRTHRFIEDVYFRDMSLKQVGRGVGITESAVCFAVRRGIKFLRREMSPEKEGG